MQHILIVEDDASMRELVTLHLTENNFMVTVATDGAEGYAKAMKDNFDLIVLDINLPKMNGLELCRTLRKSKRYIPILMMTARAEESDIVQGLQVGADDYIKKPFGMAEFIARVQAVLRRTLSMSEENARSGKILNFSEMVIDADDRTVTIASNRIDLTPKEFDLLMALARKPGRSFSRAKLLDTVWGYEFEGLEHTVNAHINRLRIKIEHDLDNPKYILTTWGVGYRFSEHV